MEQNKYRHKKPLAKRDANKNLFAFAACVDRAHEIGTKCFATVESVCVARKIYCSDKRKFKMHCRHSPFCMRQNALGERERLAKLACECVEKCDPAPKTGGGTRIFH
jgi:hypothetical protein